MHVSSKEVSLRAMARMLDRSPTMVLKWAESGLIPRLKNKKFNPEAVLKAAKANVSTRKPLGRSVNSSDDVELTPAQQAAEDTAVAAVMILVNSDVVCDAVGRLGRLPRQMLAEVQKHDPVAYPQNTLAGFEKQIVEWVTRCIEAARDE
jgi:hypothetical protein